MIYFRNARTENALQDWPRRQEDATQNELPRYVLLTLSLSLSVSPSFFLTLTYTHNFRQHKTSTSCAAFAHLIITCRRATWRGHDIESLRTLLAIDLAMAKKGNNIGYPSLSLAIYPPPPGSCLKPAAICVGAFNGVTICLLLWPRCCLPSKEI